MLHSTSMKMFLNTSNRSDRGSIAPIERSRVAAPAKRGWSAAVTSVKTSQAQSKRGPCTTEHALHVARKSMYLVLLTASQQDLSWASCSSWRACARWAAPRPTYPRRCRRGSRPCLAGDRVGHEVFCSAARVLNKLDWALQPARTGDWTYAAPLSV
jgi:hypothetical protein